MTSRRDGSRQLGRLSVLIATWASGGNLPPLLALGGLLRRAGHRVQILTSTATQHPARRDDFETLAYRAAAQPDTSVPLEVNAADVFRTLAGVEIARDVGEVFAEARPDVLVTDCMLPAALAAAQAASIPAVSVVHFLYGPARTQMAKSAKVGRQTQISSTRRARASACPRRSAGSPPGRRSTCCS